MHYSDKASDKLYEMIDEGLINDSSVVTMCLCYMSEDDIADMMDCNELSDRFLEENI